MFIKNVGQIVCASNQQLTEEGQVFQTRLHNLSYMDFVHVEQLSVKQINTAADNLARFFYKHKIF